MLVVVLCIPMMAHELDASVMDAVIDKLAQLQALSTLKTNQPCSFSDGKVSARDAERSGAEDFKTQGVPLVENNLFDTESRYEALLKAKEKLDKQQVTSKDYQAAHQALPVIINRLRRSPLRLINGNIAAGA